MSNIALIGYGYFGKILSKKIPSNSLKVICTTQKIDNQNVEVIDNYRNIPDNIDTVVISTPPETHFEIAKFMIQKGKNVLVEKPFASSLKEVEELKKLSKERGVILMVDHTFMFTNGCLKLKNYKNKANSFNCNFYNNSTPKFDVDENLAYHGLYLAQHFLNPKITGVVAKNAKYDSNKLSSLDITLKLSNGQTSKINVKSDPLEEKMRLFTIQNNHKKIIWDELNNKIDIFDNSLNIESKDGKDALTRMMENFLQIVEKNDWNEADQNLRIATNCTTILDAVRESLKEKREVKVSLIEQESFKSL